MTVIELPDDVAAALKAKAATQNLQLVEWLKQQVADTVATPAGNDLDTVFAKVRGLTDDLDFGRDSSVSRPVEL